MADRKVIDWEAIEREYRAGQISIAEIARQFEITHPAILKRAKRDGWTRNLASRVKEAVTAKLVTDGVTGKTAAETVELVAARAVQVVRDHKGRIGRGHKLIDALFGELEQVTEAGDFAEAIEAEFPGKDNFKRRAAILRAVELPSRASTLGTLALALKTLVGLERQAFNLDAPDDPANSVIDKLGLDEQRTLIAALASIARDAASFDGGITIEGEAHRISN